MEQTGWIAVFAVVVSVFALFAAMQGGTQEFVMQQQEGRDSLSVSGSAELDVSPDMVDVFVRVQEDNTDAQAAQQAATDAMNAVIDALESAGYDDVETTEFRLQRDERYDPETRQQEFRGYRAVHVLKVSSDDTSAAGRIIDLAVDNGANGIDRVEFGLSDAEEERRRQEVLELAAGQARTKAEGLASSLDVTIDEPITIAEQQFNFVPYRSEAVAMDGASGASTQVSPSDVQLSATVNVEYALS
jgi:hypothetical protein